MRNRTTSANVIRMCRGLIEIGRWKRQEKAMFANVVL